jgi:hypothetical protein
VNTAGEQHALLLSQPGKGITHMVRLQIAAQPRSKAVFTRNLTTDHMPCHRPCVARSRGLLRSSV